VERTRAIQTQRFHGLKPAHDKNPLQCLLRAARRSDYNVIITVTAAFPSSSCGADFAPLGAPSVTVSLNFTTGTPEQHIAKFPALMICIMRTPTLHCTDPCLQSDRLLCALEQRLFLRSCRVETRRAVGVGGENAVVAHLDVLDVLERARDVLHRDDGESQTQTLVGGELGHSEHLRAVEPPKKAPFFESAMPARPGKGGRACRR
jgi:hypothetical protein